MMNRLRNSARPASTWFGGIDVQAERVPGQREHDEDLGEARHHQQQRGRDREQRDAEQDDDGLDGVPSGPLMSIVRPEVSPVFASVPVIVEPVPVSAPVPVPGATGAVGAAGAAGSTGAADAC